MFGGKSSLDKGLDAFGQKKWQRSRRLLEDALAEGMTPAGDYHLGLLYWRGLGGDRDERAAAACFARAAEQGHSAAEAAFGVALATGKGVQRDVPQARLLLRSAAGAGNAAAMTELAAVSEPEEAQHWLLRACELSHPPAMRALGEFLIVDDPVEALSWLYAHAALTGEPASVKRVGALARELSADEISAAQKAGRAYARNARQSRRR